MNPKFGFSLDSEIEKSIWNKYKFFEKGISPNEFRKCQARDINDILDIKNALEDKRIREKEVQDLMNSMK